MIIQPDAHITIILTEEVIRLTCATIAFVVMCLIVPKVITALKSAEPKVKDEVR